ncbi:MAG: serine/threonine protein kinase, AGC [Candelina mexicana]|nr:MAG: serine/threonine protein kinase, AGC [Candelina mexicana]
MATAAVASARNTLQSSPPSGQSTNGTRQDEKTFVAHFSRDPRPLSPSRIAEGNKKLGASSKELRLEDFQLLKTLGTGTFARVWLVKLAKPSREDQEKVYALKILRKVDIIRLKQLDYCPGGEVFTYLRRARRFDEPTSVFYAAEIVLILDYLHDKEGVAYRDLKPENILIDAEGHLKLVDFGFAKKVGNSSTVETYTLCGTPEYLAPEVIQSKGHGTAVDWWAFGILVYEFLVGQPPFWDQNPMKIYEMIVGGRIRYPSNMSLEARDLISNLCTVDASKRLGNISGGVSQVKSHPFFRKIDWDALYYRKMKGPIIPHVRHPADASNFDDYDPEPEGREPYTIELYERYDKAFGDF